MNDNYLQQGYEIKQYKIIKFLAEGQFGKVYLGLMNSQENVAIKSVYMPKLQQQKKAYQLFQTEVKIMKQIQNENIVKFIDFIEQGDYSFVIMEFCEQGDLGQLLIENNYFKEQIAICYIKQIINGLKGLHQQFIIHRDLKLPNILIKKDALKIADLGFAKELASEQDMTKSVLGSQCTMAPEIIERKEYGLESDMYRQLNQIKYLSNLFSIKSLGIIFYQLLFGYYPYMGVNPKQFLQQAKDQKINFNLNGITVSNEIQQLIIKMTKYDRQQRIKWSELFNEKIFNMDNQNLQIISKAELNQVNKEKSWLQSKQDYDQIGIY